MDCKEIKSDMNLDSLYFDEITFKRQKDITPGEVAIDLQPEVVPLDRDKFMVKLVMKVNKGKELNMKICAAGEFSFTSNIDDIELRNNMLHTNAVAIMFPFMRSMATQITAQPNMQPIVVPTINVSKLF